MKEHPTAEALLRAGRGLFARHGYDGASVRAITARAQVNLGAVTYHFGSKRALYHAVLASFVEPLRRRVERATQHPGTPLQRIERVVRTYADYLAENPDLPKLMLQELVTNRPPPPPVLDMARYVLRALAGLFTAGQLDGSIRQAHPGLAAVSVISQPIFFHLVQPLLREVAAIDLRDRTTREQVVHHVVRFVHGGLAPRAVEEVS